MQHLKTLLLVIVFFSVCSRLSAINPPPLNDTVCDAIDLGILPVPGPCPSYPYGDTIVVNGTTDWASYNTFDFSPVSCSPGVSPDVWYKFRSTGNYIYIELFGYNNLDSMFCKLYMSQGSCLDLIPGHCESTFNGVIMAAILTPDIGAEYYLQIGGSRYDETGNFMFSLKSFNDCNDCVKNAHVELDPAPWFGRYGTNDTVTMCYTVDRWDQTTTSKLHSVIPLFGDEWDTTTLTPVSFPPVASGWMWGNNIPTPLGSWDGFYYDGDFDGDPTNNDGQPSNITMSWEFCWSISTKSYCNAYDAHVDIHTFSDNQTGAGNPLAPCNEAIPMHLSMAGWCCPDPIVSVQSSAACDSVWLVSIDPVSSNTGDVFDIILYDDSMHVAAYAPGVITTAGFSQVPSGDYLIEAYNSTTGCVSFHQLHLEGAYTLTLEQTVFGCGPGSGSAVVTPVGSTGPYTYSWQNITTFNDSLAFNLNEGYAIVDVTNGSGCTITDSIYIVTLPAPSAFFEYPDVSRCHDDDTIQTTVDPYTLGGTWQLISPLSTPITVDANDGTIHLNGTTLTMPYWIHVQYTAGTTCTDSWIDSLQIVQKPATPVPTSATLVDWCIGSTTPSLSVALMPGIPSWYGLQTGQVGIGYTLTPTLTSTVSPGQYYYVVTNFADLTFGCAGGIATFTVNAVQAPSFTMSPDVTICPDDTAYIFANGSAAYTYSWNPQPTVGAQNASATSTAPLATTIYTVSVVDGPCISTGFVTVLIDSSITCGTTSSALYNGITPNNDGHNDTWIIESAYTSTDLTVTVFNRWGQQVWRATNYDNSTVVFAGRNGKEEELPSGTYYYTIEQDNRNTATGWLELTR
jgi:gliding motility-associated-like protein